MVMPTRGIFLHALKSVQVLVLFVVKGGSFRWDCFGCAKCFCAILFQLSAATIYNLLTGASIAYQADASQCQRNLQQIFKKGACAQPADYRAVSSVESSELAILYASAIAQ